MSASTTTGDVGHAQPSPTPKGKAIRELTAAGYILIPLNGKIPAVENWNTVVEWGQYGEAELAERNYGVALDEDDLVVDIDPRNFAPGDNPVARLKAAVGPLVSFTVKTGGGGYHVYFKMPPGTLVCNSLKAYPGIEFKALNRQVVGPGSVHPETRKVYEIVHGSPSEVNAAPAALVEIIKRTAIPFSDVGTDDFVDDAPTQGRYAAWLQDAAEPSVQGKGGDANAFKVACVGRDMGLSPAVCYDLLLDLWNPRCSPPWDAEELRAKVVNAYQYARGARGANNPEAAFKDAPPIPEAPPRPVAPAPKEEELSWNTNAKTGAVLLTFHNLLNYFKFAKSGLYRLFAFNEFTGRYEFERPAPWHKGQMPASKAVGDRDLKQLRGYLSSKHGFEKSINDIEQAVSVVADERAFHPVREYLDGLVWDQKPRLDTWLTDFCGVEDSPYTRAVSRKVLCAAVMRVFKPGIKFDHVLVLDGPEGLGKSTVVEILAGDWHSDAPVDPHNRDTIQLMQGKWILELPEMEVSNRAEEEALKAFIVRKTDRARLAFGRLESEFPRQSIFIATKNPQADGTYLKGEDGLRRWWPVSCRGVIDLGLGFRQIDFAGLKAARNQLFAEAVHICRTKGERLDMETAELKAAAKVEVQARRAEHPWAERVGYWLKQKPGCRFVTGRQVYVEGQGGLDVQWNRIAQKDVSRVMHDLGWEPHVAWIEGSPVRGYAPKKADILGDLL